VLNNKILETYQAIADVNIDKLANFNEEINQLNAVNQNSQLGDTKEKKT
jgi:hypothetical protein